jgi:hypothetical protein
LEEQAKRGMFEGDLIEGELEIGQIADFTKIKRRNHFRNDCRLQCGRQEIVTDFIEIMTKIKLYIVLLFLGVGLQTYSQIINSIRCLEKNERGKWGKWSDLQLVYH